MYMIFVILSTFSSSYSPYLVLAHPSRDHHQVLLRGRGIVKPHVKIKEEEEDNTSNSIQFTIEENESSITRENYSLRRLEDEQGSQEQEEEQDEPGNNNNNNSRDQHQNVEQEEEETKAPREINDDFYAFPEDPVLKLIPLDNSDLVGFIIVFGGMILAAGSGIGGGGICLPIYMLCFGLPTSIASPLSAITVLGGAISTQMLNCGKRHPLADRPIIDWDMVLVMEPVMLVGTILGTMLQQVLSERVLVVFLVLLLGFAAYVTLNKAHAIYKAEQQFIDSSVQLDPPPDYLTEQLQDEDASIGGIGNRSRANSTSSTASTGSVHALPSKNKKVVLALQPSKQDLKQFYQLENEKKCSNDDLRSNLTQQEKITPRMKVVAVCGMFTVAIFLNTMLGGGAFQSPWGIYCGGMVFWLVHIILFSFLLACAFVSHHYVVTRHQIKVLSDYDFVHGDVKWDTHKALWYPFLFGVAGLLAGVWGIGGSLVTVPLLLVMGVHPDVATATASCMVLFTSMASTTSYAVFGLIHWDYASVAVVIGFISSFIGKQCMLRLKQNQVHGTTLIRNSYIAIAVGVLLLLSGLLLTINYIFIIGGYEEIDLGGICYDSRI